MHHQFSGTLTASNRKSHLRHTFEILSEERQADIQLKVTEGVVDGFSNMLTLTLFDSVGFRRAGHRGGQTNNPLKQRPGLFRVYYRLYSAEGTTTILRLHSAPGEQCSGRAGRIRLWQ